MALKTRRSLVFTLHGFWRIFAMGFLLGILWQTSAYAFLSAHPGSTSGFAPGSSECLSTDKPCNVCVNETPGLRPTDPQATNLGSYMIGQIFRIINQILDKLESSFYTGIINSIAFQDMVGVAFLLYIVMFGVMITFNLTSYRGGEVTNRLIKLAIVYAMTTGGGWTFFSTWIQTPVINTINELIADMANAGSGTGRCVSQGNFATSALTVTGGSSSNTFSVHLAAGPMAMLYGPMSCIFAANFVAEIEALITTGFYGWVLAFLVGWGMLEFTFMLLGAVITYIKSIIGLTFLFGIAPIFFAFYLFEKTRKLTEGWISMVMGFAVQPVMLFAFVAFYATIIGTAAAGMFVDSSGNPLDMCYVPWFTMPGMATIYAFRFVNDHGVAGGQWNDFTGSGFGTVALPPAKILNVLYFVVLCNLGKGFTTYINELCMAITGGLGGGNVTTGDEVRGMVESKLTGGKSMTSMVTSGITKGGGKLASFLAPNMAGRR